MIASLVCPLSSQRISSTVVRLTASLIILLTLLYAVTGSAIPLVFLLMDFIWRAIPLSVPSPVAWLSKQISQRLQLSGHLTDKAPKTFAARLGLLFAVSMLLLHFINPVATLAVAAVLVTFALLEAVFNICVGCIVYSYLVYPFFKRHNGQQGTQSA